VSLTTFIYPLYPTKSANVKRKVDECTGLPFVHFLSQPVLFLSVL